MRPGSWISHTVGVDCELKCFRFDWFAKSVRVSAAADLTMRLWEPYGYGGTRGAGGCRAGAEREGSCNGGCSSVRWGKPDQIAENLGTVHGIPARKAGAGAGAEERKMRTPKDQTRLHALSLAMALLTLAISPSYRPASVDGLGGSVSRPAASHSAAWRSDPSWVLMDPHGPSVTSNYCPPRYQCERYSLLL